MIMKRSIYRNLRYFLTLVLFAILGSLFILSLKGNDQNGSKLGFQSVTETENRSKFSRLSVTADKSAPKEQKAILYPFGSRNFNKEKRVTEREGRQKHEKTSPPLDIYIFEEHHEGQFLSILQLFLSCLTFSSSFSQAVSFSLFFCLPLFSHTDVYII